MNSFVLSIIGTDRPGLVEALAAIVADHGGNWERSHMTELAGMFAGMVLVEVPPELSSDFRTALEPLRDRGLMDVTLREAVGEHLSDTAVTIGVEVVGNDRPGIVNEVSHAFARLGIGIVDLQTWTESGAMAGGPLFRAAAKVRLPDGVARQDLVAALEDLSNDLMVDLTD